MKLFDSGEHPRRQRCRQTRLAESSVAAVDVCDCGVMQVHVGAVTLRLAPCALDELLSTLERAVSERAAVEERRHLDSVPAAGRPGRGQA
jgi:hypothetical protein